MMTAAGGPTDAERLFTAGARRVEALMAAHPAADSATLFRMCWRCILENADCFRPAARNRFGVDWTIMTFMKFAPEFRKARPDFQVEILSSGDRPARYGGGEGCLVLTCHSGIEKAICTQWDRLGYAVSFIAAPRAQSRDESERSFRSDRKRLFPVSRPLDIIRRNPLCLARAHDRARRGNAVVINADYTVFDAARSRHDVRISRRLLEFVLGLGQPAWWVLPAITEEGQVLLDVHALDATVKSPESLIEELRKIRTNTPYNLSRYTLGDWLLDTRGQPYAARPD